MAKIYLAGKISMENDWRGDLIDLHKDYPKFTGELAGHTCTGPIFETIGHGMLADDGHNAVFSEGTHSKQSEVFYNCIKAIYESDVVFAWITDNTAYGTIFELGYAMKCGKKIIVGWKKGNKYTSDLWFCLMSAWTIEESDSPREALIEGLKVVKEHYPIMPYEEYLQTEHWLKMADDAKKRACHRCQLCNSEGQLHAHHRTYERRGYEKPSDLIVLCSSCHAKFHDITKARET